MITAIQLAKALLRYGEKCEIKGDSISVYFPHHKESFKLPALLSNERHFADFLALSCLSHFGADVKPLDERHYITSINGLRWVVRKRVLYDINCTSLLPYIEEPHEYENWFLRILKPNDIFIDVGAYAGGYSIRACKLGADVISLEPDAENFSLLMRNCELNQCSRVHALNVAAGAGKGIRSLYAPERFVPTLYSLVRKGVLQAHVNCLPLDEAVLPIVGNREVKLMKIDVEGAELEVLKGGINTLNKTRNLMIEVWSHTEKHVLNLLKKHKFNLVDIASVRLNNYNAFFKRR